MAKKAKKASTRKTPAKKISVRKASAKKALDGRHRDKTGRIDKKHGNTLVGTLRKTYGDHFAKGRRSTLMLKTLLKETNTESLHGYLAKHHKSK